MKMSSANTVAIAFFHLTELSSTALIHINQETPYGSIQVQIVE